MYQCLTEGGCPPVYTSVELLITGDLLGLCGRSTINHGFVMQV